MHLAIRLIVKKKRWRKLPQYVGQVRHHLVFHFVNSDFVFPLIHKIEKNRKSSGSFLGEFSKLTIQHFRFDCYLLMLLNIKSLLNSTCNIWSWRFGPTAGRYFCVGAKDTVILQPSLHFCIRILWDRYEFSECVKHLSKKCLPSLLLLQMKSEVAPKSCVKRTLLA